MLAQLPCRFLHAPTCYSPIRNQIGGEVKKIVEELLQGLPERTGSVYPAPPIDETFCFPLFDFSKTGSQVEVFEELVGYIRWIVIVTGVVIVFLR